MHWYIATATEVYFIVYNMQPQSVVGICQKKKVHQSHGHNSFILQMEKELYLLSFISYISEYKEANIKDCIQLAGSQKI